jgi:predicted amidohydrolase
MRIASIQMEIHDDMQKTNTIARAEKFINEIGTTDLVILPEIWNIGYFSFDKYIAESETRDGETITRMRSKANEKRVHILAGSIVEKENGRLYNTSFLIGPSGEILGKYRKMHLFGYGSRENQLLTRGEDICAIDTELGTFGLSTCYDLRFPELFRKLIDRGAEIILTVSAWPYPRLEHWLLFNRVRAVENQAFLVSSNCVGINRSVQFCGHSMIVDPWGTVVASGGDEECIVTAEINLDKVRYIRKQFPVLKERILVC